MYTRPAELFTYAIAGVEIETNRAIAGLSACGYRDLRARVTFSVGHSVEPPPGWQLLPGGCDNLPAHISDDGQQVMIFAARDDNSIDYARELRRVVPFISALQQQIILHAGAVAHAGAAIAFVGASGAGKSTLVSTLAGLGYAVLSDDLLACRVNNDLVCAVQSDIDSAPAALLPIKTIAFLSRHEPPAGVIWARLTNGEGMRELIRNGFGELPVARIWSQQFARYCQIVTQAEVYRLQIPDCLERVADTAKIVMKRFNHRDTE